MYLNFRFICAIALKLSDLNFQYLDFAYLFLFLIDSVICLWFWSWFLGSCILYTVNWFAWIWFRTRALIRGRKWSIRYSRIVVYLMCIVEVSLVVVLIRKGVRIWLLSIHSEVKYYILRMSNFGNLEDIGSSWLLINLITEFCPCVVWRLSFWSRSLKIKLNSHDTWVENWN